MISHMYKTILTRCKLDDNEIWRWKNLGTVVDPVQLDAAGVPMNRQSQTEAFVSERDKNWNDAFNIEV